MSRIARVVVPELPHHVTQRGNNRCDVFFSDADRTQYLQTLVRYCTQYKLKLWAYCLMTNHVHLLAVPEYDYSLAQALGRANLSYTQYINRTHRRSGRLWQNRFFSCPVERDEYLWTVMRYIERNPVRAGLTEQPWTYPWSSARHHANAEPDLLVGDSDWLAPEQREEYRNYLTSDSEDEQVRIRTATRTGRPLGTATFIDRLERTLGRVLHPLRGGRPRKSYINREVS